jgi:hypothetical protein
VFSDENKIGKLSRDKLKNPSDSNTRKEILAKIESDPELMKGCEAMIQGLMATRTVEKLLQDEEDAPIKKVSSVL